MSSRCNRLIAMSAAVVALLCGACSTYTLRPITAAEAGSDYPAGGTYRVEYSRPVLVRSMKFAIGFGQPDLELDVVEVPEIGREAQARLPAGTAVTIERYVRYEQHGLYDCGANGWKFAIARVAEGTLAGTQILIDSTKLNLRDFQPDPAYRLLERPRGVSD
jgi:hypothetical protein